MYVLNFKRENLFGLNWFRGYENKFNDSKYVVWWNCWKEKKILFRLYYCDICFFVVYSNYFC